MTQHALQSLPIGTSDFAALRAAGEIYIDKTELIYELAVTRRKIFFTRPRRFGKTLLISTFESLFRYGLRDFQGLAIEKLWKDMTYQVVRFDFSEVRDFTSGAAFMKMFHQTVIAQFAAAGFVYDPRPEAGEVMLQLSNWMQSLEPNSLVLLIDNYDTPLAVMLEDPTIFHEVRAAVRKFFTVLKSKDHCLRFSLMTGVTKFSNTSIFSVFDSMFDISLLPKYGELLGITRAELERDFAKHIDYAAQVRGCSREQLLDRLEAWYSGFAFDMFGKTRVFCPWSVMHFLRNPEVGFLNYWGSSARQPRFLVHYLMKHALTSPVSFAKERYVSIGDLSASSQYDAVKLEVLLTQEGFLSIRNVNATGLVALHYPNLEVAYSMADLYANELTAGRLIERPITPSIVDLLSQGNIDDIVERINCAMTAIDFAHYPVKDSVTCRADLQVLLMGVARILTVKLYDDETRTDLECTTGSRRWVFEVRVVASRENEDSALAEALGALHERDDLQEGAAAALVYTSSKKRFTRWAMA